MSFSTNLTAGERDILSVLGIDILDNHDLKRLYWLRHENRAIVRKLIPWAKARRAFAFRLEESKGSWSLSK